MGFREAIVDELQGYPWISGTTGTAMFSTFGAAQDASVQELRDAIRMRDPARAPVDALGAIGNDRVILKAPVETWEQYRARCILAPDEWYWGGTAEGYLFFTFGPYGFTSSTVGVFSNDEIAWDGNTEWHSRVFFLVDSSSGYFTTDGLWPEDDGDADTADTWLEDEDAATWNSNATMADLRFLRSSIRLTKADYAYPVTIGVWLSGAGSLPDGFWDSPGGDWPDDVADAGGAVWDEDEGGAEPLFLTLGNVWGQEDWLADWVDNWTEDDEPMVDLPEEERWIDFPGEEN